MNVGYRFLEFLFPRVNRGSSINRRKNQLAIRRFHFEFGLGIDLQLLERRLAEHQRVVVAEFCKVGSHQKLPKKLGHGPRPTSIRYQTIIEDYFDTGGPSVNRYLATAEGGSRTHTPLRIIDFESIASAIPPLRLEDSARRSPGGSPLLFTLRIELQDPAKDPRFTQIGDFGWPGDEQREDPERRVPGPRCVCP